MLNQSGQSTGFQTRSRIPCSNFFRGTPISQPKPFKANCEGNEIPLPSKPTPRPTTRRASCQLTLSRINLWCPGPELNRYVSFSTILTISANDGVCQGIPNAISTEIQHKDGVEDWDQQQGDESSDGESTIWMSGYCS